jgi:16S rRNA G966 N2-methylase RsmD
MVFAGKLEEGSYDLALADPPYGEGLAARLMELHRLTPFASQLWVEHRSDEPMPGATAHRTRRYGDTTLTTRFSEPPSP